MSVLLSFLLLLAGALGSPPTVSQGTLDLRHWDPSRGSVSLEGMWDFQPGISAPDREGSFPRRRPVPGFWNHSGDADTSLRVASYRLRLELPDRDTMLLALRAVRPSSQSIRVLIDGKEQGQFGRFGTSPLSSSPVFTTSPIVFKAPPGHHDLVLEVANFHSVNKGIPRPMELGTPQQLLKNEILLQSFNALLAACLAFLALQFAVQWWSHRRQHATGLFSLVCLFSLLRHVATTSCAFADFIPWLDWESRIRIEYLTFGTIILWVYWFTITLFPRDLPRKVLLFLQASGAAYAFFSLTASPQVIVTTVAYYQIIHAMVIPLVLWGLVRAARRKENGAVIYMIGFALVAVSVINDILYALQKVQTGLWAPAGMLCLVVSLAIVTSRRASSQARELEAELERRSLLLASSWERHHPGFVGHQARVSVLAEQLAIQAGLPPETSDPIRRGAACHDAGMLELPPKALLETHSLSPEEHARLQAHVQPTSLVAPDAPGGLCEIETQILRHHHEHWDGSGYPDKLAGERIPLPARIVAIADIWDALIHDRPHRSALSLHDALDQLERERGRTLDPQLLDLFLENGIWKVTLPDPRHTLD